MIIAKTLPKQGLVPLRRAGVPKSVKGQRDYRAGVSDRFPVFSYEILQFPYGNMGVRLVRDEELLPRRGVPQGVFQCDSRLFAKRDFPDLSALSLDRENAELKAARAIAVSSRMHSWILKPAYRAILAQPR